MSAHRTRLTALRVDNLPLVFSEARQRVLPPWTSSRVVGSNDGFEMPNYCDTPMHFIMASNSRDKVACTSLGFPSNALR